MNDQLRYVVFEHIKLSRDMSSTLEADMCHECKCGNDIDKALSCSCECHIEIRELQKIQVYAKNDQEAEELAGKLCTLNIIGDCDIIDSGLAANDQTGIVRTKSEVFKSYD